MKEILFSILIRTPISFLVIIAFYRLTGKKGISKISVLDIGITLMIADLAVELIRKPKENVFISITPIIVLILIQYLFTYITLKNQKTRNVLGGRPSFIIKDGKYDQKAMEYLGYNLDDLFFQLRSKDINDVSQVKYAILEVSGALSIIKNDEPFAFPLILDGIIQDDYLIILGLSKEWLKKELTLYGFSKLEEVFCCTYNNDGELIFERKR